MTLESNEGGQAARLPSLLNRSNVKRLALDMARQSRPKFTRCSREFLDRIEAGVRRQVQDEIRRHPSIGITLK